MSYQMELRLPALDPKARPVFRDADACRRWVSQLQLTNVKAAQEAILGEVRQINRLELPVPERFRILEQMRETVSFIQDEAGRKVSSRPLPLDLTERAQLDAIMDLWEEMTAGYARCLQAGLSGDADAAKRRALYCQRALTCVGAAIVSHAQASHAPDPKLWRELHTLYAYAEQAGLAKVAVEDPATARGTSSCESAYLQPLLAFHASPYELQRKQYQWMKRWLADWSGDVKIARSPPPRGEGAPTMAVQLTGDRGIQTSAQAAVSEATRYLHLNDLSKELRIKLILLEQGQKPDQIGLGSDCVQPAVGTFLKFLHHRWCEGRLPRILERRSVNKQARLAFGHSCIHYFVNGAIFTQPGGGDLTDQQRKELAAFGHVASRTGQRLGMVIEFQTEEWQVLDENIAGMRLSRPASLGARVSHLQLVGVGVQGAPGFVLGVVRWMMMSSDGVLQMGVRTLPGQPRGVAVRQTGVHVKAGEKYVQAMMLPALERLEIPASLILPFGWFEPRRVIELHIEANQRVMLTALVEKGADFERVAFKPA